MRSPDTDLPHSASALDGLKTGWKAARLRSWYISAWGRLRTRIHYIRMFLRPDVVLLEGRIESGKSLSILRAGITDRQTAYFFAGQVLTELCVERVLGRTWLWALPALARKHGCAFVLFRVPRRRTALARRVLGHSADDALHLPVFVEAIVDIADRARLLRNYSLRSDVRQISKRGFEFSISTKRQDLDTFIREYHDPYVKKVHGFDAIGMDFKRLLASCSNAEIPEPWVLLKVELDGEWVAGDLLVSGPGRAAVMELGVKDGDLALVKNGVLRAGYWLSLEYLHSQGHKRVSLMHSRPFLKNGVLQYKLKFCPSLTVARPTDGFLLLFNQDNDAAREILLREPFLVFKGDGLRAVWFSLAAAASPDASCIPVDRLTIAGIHDVERVVLRSSATRTN
jgi:GNAT acetyltransferase-like protein